MTAKTPESRQAFAKCTMMTTRIMKEEKKTEPMQ